MTDFTRRQALTFTAATAATALPGLGRAQTTAAPTPAASQPAGPLMWTTTQQRRWQAMAAPVFEVATRNQFSRAFSLALADPRQTIDGIGGAFSEKGWLALASLPPAPRAAALQALFGSEGAALNLCRAPIGGNDIANDWYSYNEVPGDFEMKHFSIDHDRQTLIPFIKAAQSIRPDLKLWASPWSPPTWMKVNGLYAQGKPWANGRANGVTPDKIMREGRDGMILDDRHLSAYARYFRLYIEAYRAEGISVDLVMPQNEFNSPHPFPGCVWTAQGLARFIPHLQREMGPLGVQIFLGTLERDKPEIIDQVMADPIAGPMIRGVGVQWAGKGALEEIATNHPKLRIWASEHECGNGSNDWRYARYGWSLMKKYFASGASAWMYWNLVMPADGMSGWGWPQNSMVSVNAGQTGFTLTPDYWVMRHLSALVKPGARYIPYFSGFGYEDQLVFRNPNGDLVLVLHNPLADPMPLLIGMGPQQMRLELAADSFSTVLVPGAMLPTG